MGVWELLLIALGLAMDAFAVAVCKGLCLRRARWKHMVLAGAYFGGFQAAMPLLGYFVGVQFSGAIRSVDHWIAFGLLAIIGGNMLKEAVKEGNGCPECPPPSAHGEISKGEFSPKSLCLAAVATSIDALAMGVGFAFLSTPILPAVTCIGLVAFLLSMLGVKIGSLFGTRFKARAEMTGGVILLLMGTKILLEHLGIL